MTKRKSSTSTFKSLCQSRYRHWLIIDDVNSSIEEKRKAQQYYDRITIQLAHYRDHRRR